MNILTTCTRTRHVVQRASRRRLGSSLVAASAAVALIAGTTLVVSAMGTRASGVADGPGDGVGPTKGTPIDAQTGNNDKTINTPMVVFAANDLGMHCMQQDFSEFLILPPFNTIHAQVINRSGHEPHIVKSGITVSYAVPSNTRSADKTNFWSYEQDLFGVNLPADVGLTGSRLSGTMSSTGNKDFAVVGVPMTPIDDDGRENPYPLATVTVTQNGVETARTQAVVPVSWEINCDLCHNEPGVTTGVDILMDHDRLHGTNLVAQQPVKCASCHADPAIGEPGDPNLPSFSSAMHTAHAPRMAQANLQNECYACHPGIRTQCQRDVHLANGMECKDCHISMEAVGNPNRTPWVDEPRCGDCHSRPGFDFEQPGTLYRDSKGHSGVFCYACHGSPHAITPTVTEPDNLQATIIQGYPGTINNCSVCHGSTPDDAFFHRVDDD